MARKFGPFDTSVFYEVENRRLQRAFNPRTGFAKTGQGAVTAGTGAQLVIAAYPDGALIDGMYVENPSSETVTVTTNTASTNPRIDRLVMRLDMTAKTIAPFQIVGTPASSPSAPSLTNTATVVDMPLCQYRFPGSASAQNPGSLVDERVVAGDTAWTDLSLASGWAVGGEGARYRVVSGVCFFHVNATRSSWTSGATLLTFPETARVGVGTHRFPSYSGGAPVGELATSSSGALTVNFPGAAGNAGVFSSGSFPVG